MLENQEDEVGSIRAYVPLPEILTVTTTSSTIKVVWMYANGWGVTTQTKVSWGLVYGQPTDDFMAEKDRSIYEIPNLRPETKYFIELQGFKNNEYSLPVRRSYTTQPSNELPAAPANLVATPGTDGVSLSWTLSSNATSYKVSYGLSADGPKTTVSAPSTSYRVSGLASNTTYYFDVRSVNSVGSSPAVSTSSKTLYVPAAPTNLQGAPTITSIALTWAASTGATKGYKIRYGVDPGGQPQERTTTSLSHTLTDLTRSTRYYVDVFAMGDHGSSPAARILVTTLAGPPIPVRPTGIHIASPIYDKVSVIWSHPGGVEYEVGYGLDDGRDQVIESFITPDRGIQLRYLRPETRYFIRVRAFNESGFSDPISGTTTIGPDMTAPRGLDFPGRTFDSVRLKWAAPEDSSYLVDYEISCPGRPTVYTTATEYIVTGLVPQASNTFTVKPRRDAGVPAALSASATVVTHDYAPPTRPKGLVLMVLSTSSASLQWQASSDNVGVVGYSVRVNDGQWITATGRSHVFTGLAQGTAYRFDVRANDAAANPSLRAAIDLLM